MAKRGRKSKYETHVKPFFPAILEMCQTMTEQQIAASLGVAYSTFMAYKNEFPELTEVLKKGRQNLVAELKSALLKKAKGFEYTETKEVSEHVKWPEEMYDTLLNAGLTSEQISQARIVKTEIMHKQHAPDVAAINLALKNYDPENWANDPQMLKIRKEELELRKKQIEDSEW